MNILPVDKTNPNQNAEKLLNGLASAPSGADAFAGSFESFLSSASPGALTIQTGGSNQNPGDQPVPANSSSNDSAVVSASAPSPTYVATTAGNSSAGNTPESIGQQGTDESRSQDKSQDQSAANELDAAQSAGVQAVQSMLMLGAPLAPLAAVKTKAGSAANTALSGVAAVGDSDQQTAQPGRPILSFQKHYPTLAPVGTTAGRSAQGSVAPEYASQGSVKLNGQWDLVPSSANDGEIGAVLTALSSKALVEGEAKSVAGSTVPASGGLKPQVPDGATGLLSEAPKNLPTLSALSFASPIPSQDLQQAISASPGDQKVIVSSQPSIENLETELNSSSGVPERPTGNIQIQSAQQVVSRQTGPGAPPVLSATGNGLAHAANSDGPLIQLVSKATDSTQPEAKADNPNSQTTAHHSAAPIVKIPSIAPANKLAHANGNTAGIPKTSVNTNVPGVESYANSVSAVNQVYAGTAPLQADPGAVAATSPIPSQDLQKAITHPHHATRSAARHGDRINLGVTPKDSAPADESSGPQISKTAVSQASVAAQPSAFPAPGVPGSLAVTARTNGEARALNSHLKPLPTEPFDCALETVDQRPLNSRLKPLPTEPAVAAEVQSGFPRFTSPTRETHGNPALNLAASNPATIQTAAKPASLGALQAEGPADPNTTGLQAFTRFPGLAPLAGVSSSEAVVAGAHTANPNPPGQSGAPQPSGDAPRTPEQLTAAAAQTEPEVTAEKATRNELPAKAHAISERLPATDSVKVVQVDLTSGGSVAKPEIRFPKLNRSSDRGGIGDAQRPEHMVSTKDYEPRTELAGKNLPNSGRNDSPSRDGVRALAANELNRARVDSSAERMADLAISAKTWLDNAEQARALEGSHASARAEAHLHARLTERIWSAVETFRSTGANDWVVRIRPDQETELNLRLKMQENQLVIHAKLENGNWETLAPSWRDLQAHLANRGIQLQPLENSGDRSGWSQNFNPMNSEPQNQNPRHHAGDEGRNFQDFRELDFRFGQEVPEHKKPQPAAKPVKSGNGWESWA